MTDWSDDTFCGNLNQIIAYLLANTKATVVILLASRSRYNNDDHSMQYTPDSEKVKNWMLWEDAVATICRMHGIQCWNGASEAGLGYYRVAEGNTFIQDQIHLTDKGGAKCWPSIFGASCKLSIPSINPSKGNSYGLLYH